MPPPKRKKPNPEGEPFPIFSVEEYRTIPKRVKIDNERFIKHFIGKLAEKDRKLAEKDQQLMEVHGKLRKEEGKNLILNEKVKFFEKQERTRFGISSIQTGLLFIGGVLASVGLSSLITDPLVNFALVTVGVSIGLFGLFGLFLLRPRGGNK